MNLALPLSNRCLSQVSMSGSSPSCLVPHQLVYPLGILFYSLSTCKLHYTCNHTRGRLKCQGRWLRGSPLAAGVGGSRSRPWLPPRVCSQRGGMRRSRSTIRFCLKGVAVAPLPPQRAGATAGNPLRWRNEWGGLLNVVP